MIPKNPFLDQGRIEFASQSGLFVTFDLAWAHPALARWLKAESEAHEAELRRQGKDPFEEAFKANRKYMAPWLIGYPLLLGFAGLISLTGQPTKGVCGCIAALSIAAGLLLWVQFGLLGPPLVDAFYDGVVQGSGGNPGATLLASLFLDVQYTIWFGLAVLAILVAGISQAAYLIVSQGHR